MITTINPEVRVRNSYLAAMLHERDMIKTLAVQLVAGQVEGHLDLINDAGPVEYGTYKEVADCIAGADKTTIDYVEDLLAEFREALLQQIARVKIDTTAVILKPNGEIDAEVSVSIE